MIGNEEKVYEVILPDIERAYGEEVSNQMEKIIARSAK